MKYQVFRCEANDNKFFVTPFPAPFTRSEDNDGDQYTLAETVEAASEHEAITLASED